MENTDTLTQIATPRLSDVLEMIDEVVWSTKWGTWEQLFLSPAAERVFGKSIATLADPEEWVKVFSPGESLRFMREVEFAALSGSDTFAGEFEIVHATKGERIGFIRGKIIRDEKGEILRLEGLTSDVTERRRALKELEENRQKLLALSKLNTLGELASGIGHEINTPLSAILSKIARVESALDRNVQPTPEERTTFLRLLRESMDMVERISQIVDGLKRLSRNQRSEDLEAFDPGTSIDQALSLNRARFSNHGIHVKVVRSHVGIRCLGKPTTLFQSLVNLLNNSFDALELFEVEDKSVLIEMGTVENNVFIRVKDNGSGIEDSFKPKLFEAFQTTKPDGKGTGLGLSISRRLLRAHGGELRLLDSRLGATEFEITLPLVEN